MANGRNIVEPQVAVLFARRYSVYCHLAYCDVWDIERDALKWPGGMPIVAHPPCRSWGQLAQFSKPLPGERDLAPWAIEQARKWGGVVEHPATSRLWAEMNLPKPDISATQDKHGGWTLGVHQWEFGHKAQKKTLLYVVGVAPSQIPELPLQLGYADFVVGQCGRRKDGTRKATPEIQKWEREATPIHFAKWLCALAKRSRR